MDSMKIRGGAPSPLRLADAQMNEPSLPPWLMRVFALLWLAHCLDDIAKLIIAAFPKWAPDVWVVAGIAFAFAFQAIFPVFTRRRRSADEAQAPAHETAREP